MTKKDGIYLTKEQLEELLKKKKKKKKTTRRKKKFQEDRVPKYPQSQGIRTPSDHMQSFGTQINRSNDLAIELARQAYEKEDKAKKEREKAEKEKADRQTGIASDTSHLIGYDPKFGEDINNLKSYISREGQTFHNRLLNIERHHNPSFRLRRESGLGTQAGSNRFKTHGHHEINPNDPSTFQTIPPINDDDMSQQLTEDQLDSLSSDPNSNIAHTLANMNRHEGVNYILDNGILNELDNDLNFTPHLNFGEGPRLRPYQGDERQQIEKANRLFDKVAEYNDQKKTDGQSVMSDLSEPTNRNDPHIQKLEQLNNKFIDTLHKVRSPYNLRKNPRKNILYNINIKKESKKKTEPVEQEQITTAQLFEPEPTKEAGIPGLDDESQRLFMEHVRSKRGRHKKKKMILKISKEPGNSKDDDDEDNTKDPYSNFVFFG